MTAGVTAGLLAAAPFASATECHDSDHHESKRSHSSETSCEFTGGNAGAGSDISGDSLSNIVTQTPIAGNNIANIANCSSFLNDNLSHNDLTLVKLGEA
ncbi:hypothetical protein ACR9E3_14220 [Actinomycetospora sp. C-140]